MIPMSHRRTALCMRARRLQIDKFIAGKCLINFKCLFVCSVFSLLLVFAYNTRLAIDKNISFSLGENSVKISGNPNSLHVKIIPEKKNSSTSPVSIDAGSEVGEKQRKIAENSNRSLSVGDLDQTGDLEKDSKPKKNGIPPAKNEAQSSKTMPIKENSDESIDEVIVSKNGEKKVNSLPILKQENVEMRQVEDEVKSGNMVVKKVNSENKVDPCSGKYIFVHRIPRQFNEDLLRHCRSLDKWTDMCQFLSNMGLGPQLANHERAFSNTGWFATNQFSLEVIFHNRMKQYKCLTTNSSLASAFFVPFYAGLDVARYLWGYNITMRDAFSLSLVKLLKRKPEWKSMSGRDHFLVAGRISWDFGRLINENSGWGNNLMVLPESKNLTMLVIESSPWTGNDFAIPYPTHFHPSSDKEVFEWQNRMRRLKRQFLFSFAGAPRPNLKSSIRNEIIDQCNASRRNCRLLECSSDIKICYKPVNVMKMFQSSVFCLQPAGDSYTRRSAFDSIVAGCIPVFFHPGSAYVQYTWHLPKNYTKYSVFISVNDVKNKKISIEKELLKISPKEVMAMREEVIRLIPRVIYADPRSRLETLEDAFDLTVKGVLERVEKIRKEMRQGKSNFDVPEELNWKNKAFGTVEEHEWDPFFTRRMFSKN